MPSIEIRNMTGYKPAFIHHPEFEIGGQTAAPFMGVDSDVPPARMVV